MTDMTSALEDTFPADSDDQQEQEAGITTENPAACSDDVPSIGTILREGRKTNTNKTIEEISTDLCVRPHLLHALEADEYELLPGVAYITGFIRQYGRYLSLDAEALVARYKEMIGHENCTPRLDFPEAMDDGRPSSWMIAAAALVLMAGTYGAWAGFTGGHDDVRPDNTDIASAHQVVTDTADRAGSATPVTKDRKVSETHSSMAAVAKPVAKPAAKAVADDKQEIAMTQATDAPVESPAESPAKSPAESPVESSAKLVDQMAAPVVSQGAGSIILRARADSYVRVVGADNSVFIDKVLHAGDEFQAPDRKDLSLTTGNAGALDIIVNGVTVNPMGPVGAVRKQISLNARQLLNN